MIESGDYCYAVSLEFEGRRGTWPVKFGCHGVLTVAEPGTRLQLLEAAIGFGHEEAQKHLRNRGLHYEADAPYVVLFISVEPN